MTRRHTLALRIIAAIAVFAALMPDVAYAQSTAPFNVCTRFYTVRRGDTMARVARRFGTTGTKIMALNGMVNATLVRGRMVCVRAKADVVGPVTMTITVAEGETLSQIAARYGTTVATLRKLNRVRAASAGQQLLVPVRRIKARGV
jgi:membrane-bound lytic murein transglycosylase D